jgi:hypothetical protein
MSPRRVAAAALLFGSLSVLLSILVQDVTVDEPWHLAWSRRLWDEGRTERRSNLLYNSKLPWSLVNVAAEKAARAAGASDERSLLTAARLPGLALFGLVVALTCALGRRVAGDWAGLAAAAAVAVDPNLVAHSAVATVDAPFAVATLLVLLTALRHVEAPGPWRAAALGLALGLGFATKYTAFLLVPVALVSLVVPLIRGQRWTIAVGYALVAGIAAMAVLDAAFLGRGLFRAWDSLGFRSDLMRAATAVVPGLRLPLPADFLSGFDIVQDQERSHPWNVILFGRGHGPGVAYYFAACWALKTPLVLMAVSLAGIARLAVRRPGPALIAVAGTFAFLLAFLSFRLQAQLGYRLALMLVPLGAVLAAAGWSDANEALRRRGLALVVVLAAAESAPYLGNTLAFSNGFVLPKREAFRYLAGSNLDWGQNDRKVGDWIRRRGLPASALEPAYLRPGDNVFSVNSLAGISSPRRLRWARERLSPLEHFRHTYVRLRVDAAQYERFLDEDRSLPADERDACAAPAQLEIRGGQWMRLPGGLRTWLLCVTSPAAGDFIIEGRRGAALLGQEDLERRDWERLRASGRLGYRVGPGTRKLLVFAGGALEIRLAMPAGARVVGRVFEGGWRRL